MILLEYIKIKFRVQFDNDEFIGVIIIMIPITSPHVNRILIVEQIQANGENMKNSSCKHDIICFIVITRIYYVFHFEFCTNFQNLVFE